MPGLGAKSYVSLKEETAWGTFVTSPTARDVFSRIVRDELEDDEHTFESPALGSRTVSSMYQGEREVGGPIEFEVGFEGALLYLLKHVLGGYDFTINSPVASANTHAFSSKENLPAGLSMEVGVGGVPGDDKVFRYPGAKVSSMELSLDQGKILTCVCEFVPKDEDTNGTTGHTQLQAQTFAALKPVKFWYHTTLTVAGITPTGVRNWKFRINNDLQRRFNLAQLTAEPIPGAKRVVELEATMEFNDLTLYNAYKIATQGTFVLNMSSGTDQIVTGATPYSILISGGTSRITAGRPKVTDSGIVLQPITARLIASAGTEVTVTIVNGQATVGSEIL